MLKKQYLIKIIFFAALLIYSFIEISNILIPKRINIPWNSTSKIKGFYKLPENSLDVLIVGSSHAYCSFNPAVLYKDASIKSYIFASNEQPLWISYHYIIEALKTQNPKVIVLETFYISESKEFKRDGVNKLNIDDINFSLNKYQMLKSAYKEANILQLSSIYNYHDRWKSLNQNDFIKLEYGKLKGFTPLFKREGKKIEIYNTKKIDIPKKNLIYLKKIIDLAKKNNIELIFTYAPYFTKKSWQGQLVNLKEIAAKNNIKFINYLNLLDSIKFDSKRDFEGGHTNIYGANKVSKYLAKFLKSKYTFNENRNFEEYERLNNILEPFDTLPKIIKLKDYLNYLSNKNLYVFIAAKDEASNKMNNQLKIFGSKFDWKEKKRWSYIGVFNPKKSIQKEYSKNNKIEKNIVISANQKFTLKIESAGFNSGNTAKILINGKNVLNNRDKRGLNIVVYNPLLNKVIDVASFDTHLSQNPFRNKVYIKMMEELKNKNQAKK